MVSRAAAQLAVGQRHQPTAASASAHTWSSASRTTMLRACSGAASGYSARWWQPRLSVRASAAAATARAVSVSATSSKSRGRRWCEPAPLDSVSDRRLQPGGVADHRGVPAHRALQFAAVRRGVGDRLGRRRAAPARPPRMLGRGLPGAAADHQTFQQAVGRQPVGAVHPGAGHLAGGEQPGQLGPAVHVGDDAAAAVVRARHDRDRLPGGVDAGGPAGGRDRREAGLEAVDGARVEVDARVAGRLQPRVDGRRDDVARGQIAHRMHAGRDRIACRSTQHRAFAADGLGDQRPPAAGLRRRTAWSGGTG